MQSKDLGKKYQCDKCGTKFYDLHRATLTCPRCQAPPGRALTDIVTRARGSGGRRARGRGQEVYETRTIDDAEETVGFSEDDASFTEELDTPEVEPSTTTTTTTTTTATATTAATTTAAAEEEP